MLASATRYKTQQDDMATVAEASAGRAWRRGDVQRLAGVLAIMQVRAARDAQAGVAAEVAEQSLDAPPVTRIDPRGFTSASDGSPLVAFLAQATTLATLETMAVTQIADTGRAATNIATTVRPALTGYIRNVGATCCSRCAVLAGRFYRYSDGFLRHENCKCTMVPTNKPDLSESPEDLFRQGRITDLSKVDQEAIDQGADLGQVVNVRRRAAGMSEAGRVLERGGRLTPAGVHRFASDRTDAIRLFRLHGYIL